VKGAVKVDRLGVISYRMSQGEKGPFQKEARGGGEVGSGSEETEAKFDTAWKGQRGASTGGRGGNDGFGMGKTGR